MRRRPPRRRPPWRSLALAAAALVLPALPVLAHSWYPLACCHDFDCSKVDRLEHRGDGSMLMQVGAISVIVPAGFEALPSKDTDAHVCLYRDGSGAWKPRCVFLPAQV